jgi:hypothetical protein
MPRKPSRKLYAETLGEITIEWNYLERSINAIGYYYLRGDKEVAGHIFAGMGNVSRAEFISYLVNKFEDDTAIAAHVLHLLKMFNTLRENRNILEHSVPYQTSGGVYQEVVTKPNARGERLNFGVPISKLNETLSDMIRTRSYADTISVAIYPDYEDTESQKGEDFRQLSRGVIASLQKPVPPRKIDPLPRPEDRPVAQRQPRSSRK